MFHLGQVTGACAPSYFLRGTDWCDWCALQADSGSSLARAQVVQTQEMAQAGPGTLQAPEPVSET